MHWKLSHLTSSSVTSCIPIFFCNKVHQLKYSHNATNTANMKTSSVCSSALWQKQFRTATKDQISQNPIILITHQQLSTNGWIMVTPQRHTSPCTTVKRRSSHITEWLHSTLNQLKSCQLLHNCTKNRIWKGLQFVKIWPLPLQPFQKYNWGLQNLKWVAWPWWCLFSVVCHL